MVGAASARTNSTSGPEDCSVWVLSFTFTFTYDDHHGTITVSLIQHE